MARQIARSGKPSVFFEPLEARRLLSGNLPAATVALVPPSGASNVTVPAPPVVGTGAISGSVVDAAGKPAANVVVTLFPELVLRDPIPIGASTTAAATPTGPLTPGLQATTDAGGNYTLSSVPAGQYGASVSDPSAGYGQTMVTVAANQTATADITLVPPPVVPPLGTGTVNGSVDDSNGNGVAGVTVWLLPAGVSTDEPVPLVSPPAVPSGGPDAGSIAFPIGGKTATTDASGNFTISHVNAGSYSAMAYSNVSGTGHASIAVVDGQTTNITINLQAPPPIVTGAVTGTVQDGQGNLIAGATVSLFPSIRPVPLADGTSGGDGTSGSTSGAFVPPSPIPTVLTTTTDTQGAYSFASVPVGIYTLVVNQSGFAPFYETVTVAQSQALAVAVTLQSAPTPQPGPPPVPDPLPTPTPAGEGTLKGTVDDAGGAPVQGALVVLVPALPTALGGTGVGGTGVGGTGVGGTGVGGTGVSGTGAIVPPLSSLHALTDASGNFELDHVPAGDYIAFVAKPGKGFARLTTTVAANQTDTLTVALSAKIPPPISLTTVKALVTQTRRANATARRAAALAAKQAALAAKKLAAAAAR